MKKLLTLILLFTITLFLSANQIVIANDYNFIISNQEGFDFTDGTLLSDAKYQRTNKIAITNDTVIADRLKYHYVFFWNEADTYLGYYKTSKAPITSGTFLGQVNTNNIPLPLNAYSFALVRYDNDYVLVGNYTVKDLFIDNNLTYDALPDFNEIPIAELNGLTLNEVFDDNDIFNILSSENTTITSFSNFKRITGTGNDRHLRFRFLNFINNFTPNDLIYINLDYQFGINSSVNPNVIRHFQNFNEINIGRIDPFNSNRINQSYIYTHFQTNNVLRFGILHDLNSEQLDKTADLFSSYAINLTALGIANLTKSQMDRYYELYENPINFIYYKHADTPTGEVSSVNNYYYAAGKNLFDTLQPLSIGSFLSDGSLGGTTANITTIQTSQDITTTNASPVGSRWHTTNVIPLKNNTTYRVQSGAIANHFIIYYDEFETFIDRLILAGGSQNFTTINSMYSIRANPAFFTNTTTSTFFLFEGSVDIPFEPYAAPTDLLNLTLLFGVGNEPDLATMDTYYDAYDEYLDYTHILPLAFTTISIQFQTTFFDDGVSEQIETLGLILTFTLIAFTLMIFGFISNRRIFNLLSIGAFVVLGVFLIEFIGFIIILFGLIFINVYYTFFGDL